jgi:hypothetical protein
VMAFSPVDYLLLDDLCSSSRTISSIRRYAVNAGNRTRPGSLVNRMFRTVGSSAG